MMKLQRLKKKDGWNASWRMRREKPRLRQLLKLKPRKVTPRLQLSGTQLRVMEQLIPQQRQAMLHPDLRALRELAVCGRVGIARRIRSLLVLELLVFLE